MYTTASSTYGLFVRNSAAAPALAGGATNTITVADSRITANSIIFSDIVEGTTTPAANTRGNIGLTQRVPTTGQVIFDVRNLHASTATLSTDYRVQYIIVPQA